MDHIVAKLEELAELRAATELTRLDYAAKREAILRAVQAELDALEAEYQPLFDMSEERVKQLEAEVRSDVLETGASVRGSRVQAVFMRGRVTWDSRRLDAYAEEHPEVLDFRRQGEPVVQLRWTKESGGKV